MPRWILKLKVIFKVMKVNIPLFFSWQINIYDHIFMHGIIFFMIYRCAAYMCYQVLNFEL